jgi:hypothetical protein
MKFFSCRTNLVIMRCCLWHCCSCIPLAGSYSCCCCPLPCCLQLLSEEERDALQQVMDDQASTERKYENERTMACYW